MIGFDFVMQSINIEMPLVYWNFVLMLCFFGVIQIVRMWWWIYCHSLGHTGTRL